MVSRSETPKSALSKKDRQISPTISRTDANGHYAAVLPTGVYKMSLAER